MRASRFPYALAAPLVLWGGLHFAGPKWWTLAVLVPGVLVAWWRDGTAEDRSVTRPGLLMVAAGLVWCLVGLAARLAGLGAPRWWLLPAFLAAPALWWWVALLVWRRRSITDQDEPREPLEDPHPDVPGPRPFVVVDRTPPPEPLENAPAKVTQLSLFDRYAGVSIGGDGDEDDPDGVDEEDTPLLDQVIDAWPEKPTGGPYKSLHAADVAGFVGMSEGALIEGLAAVGVEVRKVTASPLEPDPVTGRKLPATGKKGFTHAALCDAARAMPRAMP